MRRPLKGISTIRFTTPIKKIRRYQSYSHFAKKFHREVLEKNEHANHPNIYFHCFSMNGCSTFTALWDLLDKKPDGDAFKKRVQGIIFDRCLQFNVPTYTIEVGQHSLRLADARCYEHDVVSGTKMVQLLAVDLHSHVFPF
ncbi:unnamed protein product [Heligmosomoides polygyrus]|uniref:4a-hydroxytetrahydrobiopterin dehydratase n=1 Tax=Heligmosomoides polygyrus TaxID=6339 RepID=A0A183GJQ4_HELPZ|nr:unnamed protein product [Heligmosomoides polygyrus]